MLDLNSRYKLSFYEKLTTLGNRDNIHLVRHRGTGEIYVLKERTIYHKEIYLFLQSHPMPFYPDICLLAEDPEPDGQNLEANPGHGKLYILEKYVEGPSLQQYLDFKGPMQLEDALPIMLKLCQALAFLHGQTPPIIHRDIKPSNIILTRDKDIQLIDFDSGRFYSKNKKQDTQFMGTNGFAAPEQYGGHQSDERTDIYQLGMILNYMLTLKTPAQKHTSGPAALIVAQCTEYYPERRFPNIQTLQWHLATLSEQLYGNPRDTLSEQLYENPRDTLLDKKQDNRIKALHSEGNPLPCNKKGPTYRPVYCPDAENSHPLLNKLCSYLPPGLRSHCLWKNLLSAYLYPLIIWSSTKINIVYEHTIPRSGLPVLLSRLTYLMIVFGWILLWFNYRNIQSHLPLFKTEKKAKRFLACLLYSFLYLVQLSFLLGVTLQYLP